MILAQPILIATVCFLGWLYFTRLSTRKSDRFVVGVLVSMIAVLILQPNLTTYVANLIGITRGVDLLFYFYSLFVLFCLILIYRKVRDLERSRTEIVRMLSILNARKPEDESHGAEERE